MGRPLDGIVVIDLTRLLPGPFCTQLLADLGAEVIKVEDPEVGDYMRLVPPTIGDTSYPFVMVNRNKKSVAVNLKSREGQEVLHRLVGRADIFVEQFRAGVAARLDSGQVLEVASTDVVLAAGAWSTAAIRSPLADLGDVRGLAGARRALEVAVGSGRPFSSFGPGLEAHPLEEFGAEPDWSGGRELGYLNMWRAIRSHPSYVLGGAPYVWTTEGPEPTDQKWGLMDANAEPLDDTFAELAADWRRAPRAGLSRAPSRALSWGVRRAGPPAASPPTPARRAPARSTWRRSIPEPSSVPLWLPA